MKTVCQMMYDVAKGPKMAMNDRPCNCEEHIEDMVAKWYCLRHGERQPNYPQMFISAEHEADELMEYRMAWDELDEAGQRRRVERQMDHADFRRKEIKENELMRGVK
jgi:hypothetical protein